MWDALSDACYFKLPCLCPFCLFSLECPLLMLSWGNKNLRVFQHSVQTVIPFSFLPEPVLVCVAQDGSTVFSWSIRGWWSPQAAATSSQSQLTYNWIPPMRGTSKNEEGGENPVCFFPFFTLVRLPVARLTMVPVSSGWPQLMGSSNSSSLLHPSEKAWES
jgi:hypothetical protein